ncbi:hypothetical protein BDV59DRAFT_204661 [Aspergillus ambiguus]|uniref:DUF167 domain-containing protein n=1 Tax=Aspergillus ambiguus TaxID=176160 RepID=UPI003CCCA5E4
MDLLERLSKELQTLALLGPHDDSLEYTNYHKTHPALLRALNTFPGLRHLELEFYDHWLHVSMFCAVPRVSRPWAIDPIWKDSDGVPPPPLFPNLQHLYLNGCLAHWLLPEDLILAFSQQQLPSLKSLVIDRLLYKDDGGTVFVPEVFRRMNRLSEFNWVNYDFETNVTHTKGGPHAPLMREHLDALKERHGETLQLLSLNYTGLNSAYASDGEWILTKEYLTGFIKEMPMLDKIYIDIPIAGVKIQVGKATSDSHMANTSSPLFRLVQVATTKPFKGGAIPRKYNLQILCNVKPNASGAREGITAVGPDKIDVCVAAAPKKGEANAAVSRVLAQILRVPKSNVDVIRGLKSRDKVISIADVDIAGNEERYLQQLRQQLEEAVLRKS